MSTWQIELKRSKDDSNRTKSSILKVRDPIEMKRVLDKVRTLNVDILKKRVPVSYLYIFCLCFYPGEKYCIVSEKYDYTIVEYLRNFYDVKNGEMMLEFQELLLSLFNGLRDGYYRNIYDVRICMDTMRIGILRRDFNKNYFMKKEEIRESIRKELIKVLGNYPMKNVKNILGASGVEMEGTLRLNVDLLKYWGNHGNL